jgi:photosystem I P700 chlorophyll a apoprotein A1
VLKLFGIVGQEILNGDVGGGFQGIQITSGFFQLWRASGITSELQLYSTAIGGLVMAAAMFFCWLVPLPQKCTKLEWFPECRVDVKSPFSWSIRSR